MFFPGSEEFFAKKVVVHGYRVPGAIDLAIVGLLHLFFYELNDIENFCK